MQRAGTGGRKGAKGGKSGSSLVDLRTGAQETGLTQPVLTQTVHSIRPLEGTCCSRRMHSSCGCRCHLLQALQRLPLHQMTASLQVAVDFICDCRRSVGCQMEPWMILPDRDVFYIATVGIHAGEDSPGATNGMSTLSRSAKRRRRRKMLAVASILKLED